MIPRGTKKVPLTGLGHFQWNWPGWFGSQAGCSAWMLFGGILLSLKSPWLGGYWVGMFVVLNAAGFWLYFRRDRILPYPAVQLLLLVCGVTSISAWTLLVVMRPDLLPLMQATALKGYLCLMIIPGIMLSFHFKESAPTRIRKLGESDEETSGEH